MLVSPDGVEGVLGEVVVGWVGIVVVAVGGRWWLGGGLVGVSVCVHVVVLVCGLPGRGRLVGGNMRGCDSVSTGEGVVGGCGWVMLSLLRLACVLLVGLLAVRHHSRSAC